LVLVSVKAGGTPQPAKNLRGFQYDVTFPPINTIVFQILKILVGGFFPITTWGGVLIKKQK
jgi:hypothetical protein